ncbi:2,4'-dihydroxyacetophenone dioxygenase family protein [Mycobacterium sp. C31M]
MTIGQAQDLLIQANELPWQEYGPGMSIKVLRVSEETGAWTCLLKMEPGSVFTRHFHKGAIDMYVLKGELKYRAGVVKEGGFAYEPLGVLHEATNVDVETIIYSHLYGALEFMDDDDNVIFILDWAWAKDYIAAATAVESDGRLSEISYQRQDALQG